MDLTRRQMLLGLGALGAAALLPEGASASRFVRPEQGARQLSFLHLHTGERGTFTYRENGGLVLEELARLNHLLRDHRTDDLHAIDTRLLDQLYVLQKKTGHRKPYEIISAYRSPHTNAMLARRSGGVAKQSLHMQGQAIDIAVEGVPLSHLHRAALSLKAGGVGYYADSGFIHLDTGRVRRW
jgi:uncharacterized protein YcbK (DUF882 family)